MLSKSFCFSHQIAGQWVDRKYHPVSENRPKAKEAFIAGYEAKEEAFSRVLSSHANLFRRLTQMCNKNGCVKENYSALREAASINSEFYNGDSRIVQSNEKEAEDKGKVFTLEDIKEAIAFGYNAGYYNGIDKENYIRPDKGDAFEDFIQSLSTQKLPSPPKQ